MDAVADMPQVAQRRRRADMPVRGPEKWASPGSPDTSDDMMWSGANHEQGKKEVHGRVQA